MKLCLLQLARLGDIFQTAPAINAYKRNNPDHHITLIVRNKFAEAAHLLTNVDEIIELPSAYILKPLIQDQADTTTTIERLENWLVDISNQQFDKVINLSFSPLTSWITSFLEQNANQPLSICGYSRTTDGYLSIPDDMSAYVYAQVGWDRSNRFHLNEIFGTLMGVDLEDQDWSLVDLKPFNFSFDFSANGYLAIQIRASTDEKSIPVNKISVLLNQLKPFTQIPIVLMGASSDQEYAEQIINSSSYPKLFNLVGKTNLVESAAIIKYAALLLAPDSSLQNLASLTQTKTLLVACGPVNFWETGPRALGSMILNYGLPEDINVDELTSTVVALLNHTIPLTPGYLTVKGNPCYQAHLLNQEAPFAWSLIRSIYQGAELPAIIPVQFQLAVEKLNDVNQFTIELLEQIQNGSNLNEKAPFLERANEIIMAIYDLCEEVKPIIDWFNTEKLRIGPGSDQDVLNQTLKCHQLLNELCHYVLDHNKKMTTANIGAGL